MLVSALVTDDNELEMVEFFTLQSGIETVVDTLPKSKLTQTESGVFYISTSVVIPADDGSGLYSLGLERRRFGEQRFRIDFSSSNC